MRGFRHSVNIVIGQYKPRRRFNMRREHNIWFCILNGSDNVFDRSRCKGRLRAISSLTGFIDTYLRSKVTSVKYLAPAKGKPTIPDDKSMRRSSELTRNSLHRKCTSARDQRNGISSINIFKHCRDICHDTSKASAHMI